MPRIIQLCANVGGKSGFEDVFRVCGICMHHPKHPAIDEAFPIKGFLKNGPYIKHRPRLNSTQRARTQQSLNRSPELVLRKEQAAVCADQLRLKG